MNVTEMLKTMALLSVGIDSLTPQTEAIFLRYLNIAHTHIYNKIASINPDIVIRTHIITDAGSDRVTLDALPFLVSSIYVDDDRRPLSLKSYADFVALQRTASETGRPLYFMVRKKEVTLYPVEAATPYALDIFYVPQPTPLTIDTGEDDIPLPLSFQTLLVDEALYYLFLDEEGFKSPQRALEAKARATDFQNDLVAYLYGNTNQTLSTFSNI